MALLEKRWPPAGPARRCSQRCRRYFPLHGLAKAELLLERAWPASVEALIAQQVKEPAEEARLAAAMPVLTGTAGEVSDAVRQQYEESPYPRWVRTGFPIAHSNEYSRRPEHVPEVLFAGCGTGLSAVEFALHTPRSRILAIDLSRASLGYAKRMAQKFGLANIEFAQADIMKLASIERQFELIDASGVLHHLADLWEGWRLSARTAASGRHDAGRALQRTGAPERRRARKILSPNAAIGRFRKTSGAAARTSWRPRMDRS